MLLTSPNLTRLSQSQWLSSSCSYLISRPTLDTTRSRRRFRIRFGDFLPCPNPILLSGVVVLPAIR